MDSFNAAPRGLSLQWTPDAFDWVSLWFAGDGLDYQQILEGPASEARHRCPGPDHRVGSDGWGPLSCEGPLRARSDL